MTYVGARRLIGWLLAIALSGSSALAGENLETERLLADVIQQGAMGVQGGATPNQRWALLPEIGYSPEKGLNGGIKFTNRDATPAGLTIDVEGGYALRKQQNASLAIVAPHFFERHRHRRVAGKYAYDPTKEFFGLGNNNVGPDPLSTNAYRLFSALATIAYRPLPRLTAALTLGFSHVHIGTGDLEDSTPSTPAAFPDLVGINGGYTNPIAFSLVYNNREEITRPTRGWNLMVKVQHVDRLSGATTNTRATSPTPAISTAAHAPSGDRIARRRPVHRHQEPRARHSTNSRRSAAHRTCGGSGRIASWGSATVVINGEYRLKLLDFNFFDFWRVRIDGVAFGDMGRVFLDDTDLSDAVRRSTATFLPRVFKNFRYSYGGGSAGGARRRHPRTHRRRVQQRRDGARLPDVWPHLFRSAARSTDYAAQTRLA